MARLLNVGGGPVQVPPEYRGWEVTTLDIDETVNPDICLDARELAALEPGQYDVVYASHVLEHFSECDVARVLWGFYHVLAPDGYAHIKVPDALSVCLTVAQNRMELDDVLYTAPVGPIRVCDVLWGWQAQITRSGQPFYSHRYGFSRNTLGRALKAAHFEYVEIGRGRYELRAFAYKRRPDGQEGREGGGEKAGGIAGRDPRADLQGDLPLPPAGG